MNYNIIYKDNEALEILNEIGASGIKMIIIFKMKKKNMYIIVMESQNIM